MTESWYRDTENACSIQELLHLTKRALNHQDEFSIAGLVGGGKGFFISLLGREMLPLLVITPDQDEAEALWDAIRFFAPPEDREGILLFPSDGIPYGDIIPWGLMSQRTKTLRFFVEEKASLVIAPIQGLSRLTPRGAGRGSRGSSCRMCFNLRFTVEMLIWSN